MPQPDIPRPKSRGDSDSALIMTFAHDLRQPLRSIVMSAQRLQRDLQEVSPDSKAKLDEILAAARRQDELITSVVEYDQALHPGLAGDAPLALRLAIQTACMKIDAFRLAHRGSIRFEPDVVPKMLAPSGMSRVVEKILHNSLKFHAQERSPLVEIQALEATGGLIEIRVSDQGIGVEPRFREMVFEPFKRLNPGSDYPGSGLGLSTARRLLDSIQGTIRFEDREPTPGAMVIVSFPRLEIEN
jgi:signal transduction histidine kinase